MKRSEIAKCRTPSELRDYYRSQPENRHKTVYQMESWVKITIEKRNIKINSVPWHLAKVSN